MYQRQKKKKIKKINNNNNNNAIIGRLSPFFAMLLSIRATLFFVKT